MAHVLRAAAAAREKRCASTGVAVIWDNDDDIRTVPRGAANYRDVGGMKAQRAWTETQAMVRAVDAVTTPSAVLADQFRRIGQTHVEVIENYLPRGRQGAQTDASVASRSAGSQLASTRWTSSRSDCARRCSSCSSSALSCTSRRSASRSISTIRATDARRYFRSLISPGRSLASTSASLRSSTAPSIASRSNVKLKEYAAVGVPWLASPVTPYADLGEDEGGRLVADDDWGRELLALVDDGETRQALAQRAHAWARRQLLSAHAGRWEQVLQAAVERARSRARAA